MNISVKFPKVLLAVFVIPLVIAGCSHKKGQENGNGLNDLHINPQLTRASSDFYAVNLSAQSEIPPIYNLDASGKLFLEVNKDTTKIYFALYIDSLKNITKATINYGTEDYNGPAIATLYPARHSLADSLLGRTFSGLLRSSVITEIDLEEGALSGSEISDLVRVIRNDSAYVQIHTKYHRSGAIRGPIKTAGVARTRKSHTGK